MHTISVLVYAEFHNLSQLKPPTRYKEAFNTLLQPTIIFKVVLCYCQVEESFVKSLDILARVLVAPCILVATHRILLLTILHLTLLSIAQWRQLISKTFPATLYLYRCHYLTPRYVDTLKDVWQDASHIDRLSVNHHFRPNNSAKANIQLQQGTIACYNRSDDFTTRRKYMPRHPPLTASPRKSRPALVGARTWCFSQFLERVPYR